MSVVHAANALPRHHGRRWVCSQGCCLGSTIRHLQWQQTGVTEVSSFSLPVPRCAQCPAMKFHKKERLGLFTPWKHSAGTKGTENAENAGTQNIQTYPQKIAIPSDLMRDSLSDAPDSASQDHHHCSGVILGKGTKRVNLGTTWNHLKPLGFKDTPFVVWCSTCCRSWFRDVWGQDVWGVFASEGNHVSSTEEANVGILQMMLSFDAFQTKRCPTQISFEAPRCGWRSLCKRARNGWNAQDPNAGDVLQNSPVGLDVALAEAVLRNVAQRSSMLWQFIVFIRPLSSYVQFQKDFSMRCGLFFVFFLFFYNKPCLIYTVAGSCLLSFLQGLLQGS